MHNNDDRAMAAAQRAVDDPERMLIAYIIPINLTVLHRFEARTDRSKEAQALNRIRCKFIDQCINWQYAPVAEVIQCCLPPRQR